MTSLLQVTSLEAGYGPAAAIKGVSLEARAGEVTALLGANGAGKTTTMLSISGLLKLRSGEIRLDGTSVGGLMNDAIVRAGIVQVPQGRQVFPAMTVLENLTMGAFVLRHKKEHVRNLEEVLTHFPRLSERRDQLAGTLSGGEQQMLAIGRALMAKPRVLLLDEPSLGLAPVIVDAVYAIVQTLMKDGLAIVLAEQNVTKALSIASSVCLIKNGEMFASGPAEKLRGGDLISQAYLG